MLEKRSIIMHVDMDAFFASVEQKDNPKLKGKPVIVGGIGERGVVSTCSYEARKYGVHSAMPIFIAKQKCPFGIYLPTRHERYKEISENIFKILYNITTIIEPVSIDEAYLDISHLKEEPLCVAENIKKEVMEKENLTLSIGISYNKFLAKLASDWNKPNGIKIITKEMIPNILYPLSIDKVHGIGKKTVKKLNNIGIYTVKDLYDFPKEYYIEYFGKWGFEIYERIRGIDKRKVNTERETKSIGREITLKKDIADKRILKKYLKHFANEIEVRLKNKHMSAKTVTIKIKDTDFQLHTRSRTLNKYICSKEEISRMAFEILDEIKLKKDVRLIGLTVSNLSQRAIKQLNILDDFYLKEDKI